MPGRNAALRLAFVLLLTLPPAGRLLAAPDPQVKSPSRVAQTAPTRTTEAQVCVREVPDLSRFNSGSAGAVLGRFDLVLGSLQPQRSAAPKGTIVGQSVKPGTQVRCGTRIDVSVSEGVPDPRQQPPVTGCPVPSLINHSVAEVRERLRGWTIGQVEKVETRGAQEGTILKQAPAPRTMVKCNSSIDIAVAVAPPPPFDPPSPTCQVPDVRGIDIALARRSLDAANLRVGSIETGIVEGRPRGMVLSQSLKPFSRVLCGATVNLQVAVTAPPCVVPAVESGDVASARQALARRNLVLGSVNRRTSEKSPGTVIGQQPAPEATIACGSSVDVWIAVPLPLVRVPPLQGQDAATARRTLEGVGLALGSTEKRESEQPVGGVVDQRPQPDTEVKPGTAVNVWLSAGVPLVQIPDLRGRDRGTASDILGSLNLRLGEVSDRAADATPGSIVDQQPRPGTMARRDTPVRVWVAASIEVPSVIGRREADATAILTNQRLRVGTIQTRESSAQAGTVIEQHPQPRRPARLNAPVDLVLAVPVTVVVPDLRGRNRQAATAALASAQLQLGETTDREADGPAGLVLEQSPRADERVEVGTAVQVWVAVPVRVQVPDLRGSMRDDSSNLLRARRLVLGSIESRVSVEPAGRIVGQQPAAGARVEVGTPVTIWIAAPSPVDIVPPQVTPLVELPGTGVNVVLALPPVPPPGAAAETPPPPAGPQGPPTLLVWLLLGAGVAAALAGIAVKARARTPREPRALAPSITLAPHPDPKMSVELSADGPFTRSELWLRPSRDAGTQTIQGSGPRGLIEVTEMR